VEGIAIQCAKLVLIFSYDSGLMCMSECTMSGIIFLFLAILSEIKLSDTVTGHTRVNPD
jgi:hypothetical protein